ncbi:tyrosine-type recombinase/integrase [Mesorhizobium sp. BHbdii]
MFIPVVDKLAMALEPLDRSQRGTVLKSAYKRPFSEKSLTGMMQHWTRQAGIPDGYTLHGLRRTFGTYLAECNVQARAIMEAMGHSSMTVTNDYVREANKRRIAVDIARAIIGFGNFLSGRHEQAVIAGRRAGELNPGFSILHGWLAAPLARLGQLDEAKASAGRLLSLDPHFTIGRWSAAVGIASNILDDVTDAMRMAGLPA